MEPYGYGVGGRIPHHPTPLAARWAKLPWVALLTPTWAYGPLSWTFSKVTTGGFEIVPRHGGPFMGVGLKLAATTAANVSVRTPYSHAGYTGPMTQFALGFFLNLAPAYDYACGTYDGSGTGLFFQHPANAGKMGAFEPTAPSTVVDAGVLPTNYVAARGYYPEGGGGYTGPIFLAHTRNGAEGQEVFIDGVRTGSATGNGGSVGIASGGYGPKFTLGNIGTLSLSTPSIMWLAGRLERALAPAEINELYRALVEGTFFDEGDGEFFYLTADAPTLQYARPESDIATNGWQSSLGGTLAAALDETTQDDGDYIYSPGNPTTQAFEVKLSAIGDPGSSSGHVVRVGLQAVNADVVFDLYLVQGTDVLDSWQESVTAGAAVTRSRTLSGAVADSITDYSDLRIRGVAHG